MSLTNLEALILRYGGLLGQEVAAALDANFAAVSSAQNNTYTPGWPSSTPRTVQSRLQDCVDIRDWAGVGLGNDDTAAFRAAILQAAGGELRLPGGTTYHTQRLDLNSGTPAAQVWTMIRGQGMATIKLVDHTNDHLLVVGAGDQLILENIHLDGNMYNQTGTSHALYFPEGDPAVVFKELPAVLSNCIIRYALTDCIHVDETRSHGFMQNVTAEFCGRDAYCNMAVDWQHVNISIGGSARDAIRIGNEWSAVGVKAYSAGQFDATGANIHMLGSAVNVRISGMQCDSSYCHGIKVEKSSATPYEPRAFIITDTVFSYNSRGTPGSYDDIYVDGPGLVLDGIAFVSAYSGPGGAGAITEKYNIEFGPNFLSTDVVDAGRIENYLGAVTPPGTYLGITNDYAKFSWSNNERINEAVPTYGRNLFSTAATRVFLQSFVVGEAYARLQQLLNGNMAWGGGVSAVDSFFGRTAATVIGAYAGTSLQTGAEGTWNGGHQIMGGYHFWVDAEGRLRIKSGAPASDHDGTVVGTQS